MSSQKTLSLLPTLGLLISLYLITQFSISNWALFFAWLLIGLVVYFGYGHRHSRLDKVVG